MGLFLSSVRTRGLWNPLRVLLPSRQQRLPGEDTDQITGQVERVEGWLTPEEGRLLYRLARNCTGAGVIVEIGSWKGKSAIWLGKGSKAGAKIPVCAVDPHTGSPEHRQRLGEVWTFDEFQANIRAAGLVGLVVPLRQTSEEAACFLDAPVELIFIDGAHEYATVRLDFELWSPKVIAGGIMAFHDADAPGPRAVIEEFVVKPGRFRHCRFVHSILVAQKVQRASAADRLRNRCSLLSRSRQVPALVRRLARRIGECGT
jgi:predicted O-methyltransferase YrrM